MSPTEAARLDIYIVAIGGTGMAPLACLLQEHAHLEPAPDLVVVGNAVRGDNPEALAAERLGVPVLSMPQALARFFLAGRRPLVVTGTHGKTTTTAMAAWVYSQCGAHPGYLVGGVPRDLPGSFAGGGPVPVPTGEAHAGIALSGPLRDAPRAHREPLPAVAPAPAPAKAPSGAGGRFIVEGDEYNAAYFDRGAKFLHYRPETLILTGVEYDHADLYASPEALREAYRQVIAQLPASGLLVACGDTPEVRELARRAPCRTILYGLEQSNEVRPAGCEWTRDTSRFRLADAGAGEVTIELPLAGSHNVANALAVWTAARRDGLGAGQVAAALAGFHGVRRRLEELGSRGGVTVVDDFAHHPTAVGKTLAALRQSYPGHRLVAAFEPRSLTAGRARFFDAYREAFAAADRVLFAPTFHGGRLTAEERLDFAAVAAALAAGGVGATRFASIDELLACAVAESRPGDVLVTMSSGSFEDLPRRLLAALPVTPAVSAGGAEARAAAGP
jgi:UDP-N-acetylmuramate: L-alanyl-gamma-D-glutamyl-meso-diaminopimelate ligase